MSLLEAKRGFYFTLTLEDGERPQFKWHTEKTPFSDKLPKFKRGRTVRQSENYAILMEYKGDLPEPGKERFFIVPLNDKANTLLESAAELHHINTERRKLPKDETERTWVRMDFSQGNWDSVITHDRMIIPMENEDSIPPLGYLEQLLGEGKKVYVFPDVIIHSITVPAGSRRSPLKSRGFHWSPEWTRHSDQ